MVGCWIGWWWVAELGGRWSISFVQFRGRGRGRGRERGRERENSNGERREVREKKDKIIICTATVIVHICSITVAIVHKYTTETFEFYKTLHQLVQLLLMVVIKILETCYF